MRFLQRFVSIIRAAYCLTWLFAPIGVGTLILSLFARVAQTQEFVSHVNFRQQLQTPIDVTWVNAPTRASLERLSSAHRVAVFIDRRLDPDRTINLRMNGTSFEDGIRQLARGRGWGVSVMSPLIYVGPMETTGKLATLLEFNRRRIRRLPNDVRRRWQRLSPTQWPRLAEPRQLVEECVAESGVSIQGLNYIPHDLWPQKKLPQLSLIQKLTILLAGFDLTVSVERDGTARVLRIPTKVALTRRFALSDAQRERMSELDGILIDVPYQQEGKQLIVKGRVEDHDAVSAWLKGPKRRRTSNVPGSKRYTLNVQNQPLDAVLASLTQQLALEVEWVEVSADQKKQRISFQVRDATLRQLLQTTVEQGGLAFQLQGKKLLVSSR